MGKNSDSIRKDNCHVYSGRGREKRNRAMGINLIMRIVLEFDGKFSEV